MPLFEAGALAEKARAFEGRRPEEILAWALAEYAPRVAISTAFGVEGCALLDMAVAIDPGVQVFTVDTDFLFPETRELMERLQERYRVKVTVFRSAEPREVLERKHGLALWSTRAHRCRAL